MIYSALLDVSPNYLIENENTVAFQNGKNVFNKMTQNYLKPKHFNLNWDKGMT